MAWHKQIGESAEWGRACKWLDLQWYPRRSPAKFQALVAQLLAKLQRTCHHSLNRMGHGFRNEALQSWSITMLKAVREVRLWSKAPALSHLQIGTLYRQGNLHTMRHLGNLHEPTADRMS